MSAVVLGMVGVAPAGAAGTMSPSPTSLNFGGQPVGVPSAPLTVTITNSGPTNFAFVSPGATITTDAAEFGISSSTCFGPMTPGSTCQVSVVYTPNAAGPSSGTLEFTSTAPNSPLDVALTGTGLATPLIGFTPSSVTFPNTAVGSTSANKTVTVTNTGSSKLTIGSVSISGGSFGLVSNTCTSAVLAPGAHCLVRVNFTPTSATTFNADLQFSDNAPGSPQSVHLSGTGFTSGPGIAFNPASLTFADTPVGSTAGPSTITVTNTGGQPLNISDVSSNAAQFAVSSTNCTTGPIAPGDTCKVGVTFTPTGVQAFSGGIVFTDDATSSPQTVPVSGSGIASAPGISFNPSPLTFPNTGVGLTAGPLSITVTNSGNAPLNIASVASNAAQFNVSSTNCTGGPIAPGDTCKVGVTFTPTGVQAFSGGIVFTDDAAGSPQTVTVVGNGIPNAPDIAFNPSSLTFNPRGVGTTSAAQTETVTNTGTQPLDIFNVSLAGANPGSYGIVSNTCTTGPVAPGNTCTVGVTFTPAAAGSLPALLNFSDDALTASPQSVPLNGTGELPGLAFNPASLTFPGRAVGTTSAAKTVTVTNTGTGPLHITNLAVGGTNPGDFSISTQTCTTGPIAAGGTCTATVRFTPTAIGARTAEIDFTDDAAGSPQAFPLNGTGLTNGPVFNVSPNPLNFGSQGKGTTSPAQPVTVLNSGNQNLVISGISTGGANPGDFVVTNTGNCLTTLAPGASCVMDVAFSPSAVGARTATLLFNDNAAGSPQSVTMNGTGVGAAAIDVSPPSVAFGNQNVGTTSAFVPIQVTNTGPPLSSLLISNTTIGGPNASDFAISSNGCVGNTLSGGSSCFIDVTFSPGAIGTRTGELDIFTNLNSSPTVVPLGGNGTPGPVASFSPNPPNLAFGNQLVGTTSPAQTVTVTNTGIGNLIITAITKAGANPSMFNVTGCTPLPATLAPGASCTLSVTFHPTSAGPKSATVSLTDNAPGSPQVINLTGTGVTGPPPQTTVTVSNTDLTFGVFPAGTSSPSQTVTIHNTGSNPYFASVVNSDPTDFHVTADTCDPGPTAPGSSCHITVHFNAPAAGAFMATLTVNDNTPSSPEVINMVGKAT